MTCSRLDASPRRGHQMGTRSTFRVHFDFVTEGQKPENMEGRRSLLLILMLAACFYGNAAQQTGGCDYVAVISLPAYQHAKEPPFIIASSSLTSYKFM